MVKISFLMWRDDEGVFRNRCNLQYFCQRLKKKAFGKEVVSEREQFVDGPPGQFGLETAAERILGQFLPSFIGIVFFQAGILFQEYGIQRSEILLFRNLFHCLADAVVGNIPFFKFPFYAVAPPLFDAELAPGERTGKAFFVEEIFLDEQHYDFFQPVAIDAHVKQLLDPVCRQGHGT